jgi:hypothetical protein
MSVYSGDIYSVSLGLLTYDDSVEYFIIAIDNSPNENSNIDNNAGIYYSFTVVSSDVSGPIITDISQSAENITVSGSITISCTVTDLNGIQSVTLYYRIDGSAWIAIEMIETSTNVYSITLDSFTAGDFVQYYIEAIDDSIINNPTIDNNEGDYYSFKILADPTSNTPFIGGYVSLGIILTIALAMLSFLQHRKKSP